jgi:hypothetical protein
VVAPFAPSGPIHPCKTTRGQRLRKTLRQRFSGSRPQDGGLALLPTGGQAGLSR